mmetsp:Transcript_42711/g.106697  ORF Transcript_42711/g.106697 Transcript_42711/m.106697 type:complete len:101 (-) Transcript_42711:184-486(-)
MSVYNAVSVPTRSVLNEGGGRCSEGRLAGLFVMLTPHNIVVVVWRRRVDRKDKRAATMATVRQVAKMQMRRGRCNALSRQKRGRMGMVGWRRAKEGGSGL